MVRGEAFDRAVIEDRIPISSGTCRFRSWRESVCCTSAKALIDDNASRNLRSTARHIQPGTTLSGLLATRVPINRTAACEPISEEAVCGSMGRTSLQKRHGLGYSQLRGALIATESLATLPVGQRADKCKDVRYRIDR